MFGKFIKKLSDSELDLWLLHCQTNCKHDSVLDKPTPFPSTREVRGSISSVSAFELFDTV